MIYVYTALHVSSFYIGTWADSEGFSQEDRQTLCEDMLTLVLLKLNNLNFQPLEVVSRYRDTQLQVAENYWYLFIWHKTFVNLNTHFIPNNLNKCILLGLYTIHLNPVSNLMKRDWNQHGTTLEYFSLNPEDQRVFSIWNHHACLS